MDQIFELLLQFLAQFAGGPGPAENNLVRFALPAAMWGILLFVAWSRQRHGDHPREKWLVWGFALGFLRELLLFVHLAIKMLNDTGHDVWCNFVEPIEHTLGLAAIVVIGASFLRYILDDPIISGRYLRIGLVATAVACLVTVIWWPSQLAANPLARFHDAGSAVLLHLLSLSFLGAAIVILVRKRGWLRNVVILAFSLLFLAEFIILLNFATGRAYVEVLCPIGNAFHILAVPLFGFVYFREMSLDKNKAQQSLSAYRDHLEELVAMRTSELTAANKQLEKTAVLEERQRIAAEMHDGLAQTLSYLGLKTDRADELLQKGQVDQVMGEFDHMKLAIGQAALDVRRSIASLQESPQPRRSLQEVLRQLIDELPNDADQQIHFVNRLPRDLYLSQKELGQVAKIVQEALLNAVHHSLAKHITVQVTDEENNITIEVIDDGRGFDPEAQAFAADDHFGLSIMEARAARIGGDLIIHSNPEQGTQVVLAWRPGDEMLSVTHKDRKDQPAGNPEPDYLSLV